MSYDWTIDHETRTILVRGTGEAVTADTLRLIEEMKSVVRESPGYDFLYNSAALQIQSNAADMVKVANALFRDTGARFRRFAIVVPSSRVALARIFAALAHPFGVTANVFEDEESAREWLAAKARERGAEPGGPRPLPEP